MSPVKKLIFAPLFLVLITFSIYFYKLILDQYLDIFFKTYGGLYEFTLLAIPLLLASLTYCIFITLSQDFKYALIVSLITAASPFMFLNPTLAIVVAAGILISLNLIYFNLQTELKSYVNFQPGKLLKGPIKLLNTFLLLTFTFGYFLNTNSIIQTQGFKIPDSVIDWSIDLSLQNQGMSVKGVKYLAQIPTLTQEQLDLLRQNPQVLEQFGLDPNDLDQFSPNETQTPSTQSPNRNAVQVTPSLPTANLKDIMKAQISNSLDQMIKPYLFAIPLILAFLFYSLTSFIIWILSFLISPILMLIFSILEKSSFIKFTTETREVKKIIV